MGTFSTGAIRRFEWHVGEDRVGTLPFLDGVRGLAALAVVLYHAADIDLTYGLAAASEGAARTNLGAAGVGVFFFLSAFLLSRNIAARPESMTTVDGLAAYGWRRAIRIYPLFTLYLLCALTTSAFLLLATGTERGMPFFVGPVEVVQHLAAMRGYAVTWTIAIEMKFYLLLPCLAVGVLWLSRIDRKMAAVGIVLAIAIALAFTKTFGAPAGQVALFPFLSIFLIGGAAGTLDTVYGERFRTGTGVRRGLWAYGLASLGAVLMVATITPVGPLTPITEAFMSLGSRHLGFVAAFLPFFAACLYGPARLRACLAVTPLRYLGAVSFSVYLMHTIAISLVGATPIDAHPHFEWIVVAVLTYAMSHLTYCLIERPAMGLRQPRLPDTIAFSAS